jgi:hypothetical protein
MLLLIKIHTAALYNVLLLLLGFKLINVSIVSTLLVLYKFHSKQKPIIKKISLILLNVNALKLQANVVILKRQKFINKNDVKPISSQPIIIVNKLLLITKKTIENINQFISKINSSPRSSNLK